MTQEIPAQTLDLTEKKVDPVSSVVTGTGDLDTIQEVCSVKLPQQQALNLSKEGKENIENNGTIDKVVSQQYVCMYIEIYNSSLGTTSI